MARGHGPVTCCPMPGGRPKGSLSKGKRKKKAKKKRKEEDRKGMVSRKEKDKVKENCSPVEIVPEESPKGDSQSNGAAERYERILADGVRTLKDNLEFKYTRTKQKHSIWDIHTLPPGHGGTLLSSYRRRS